MHVDGVVGVGPAVDDVHHRRRHHAGAGPAEVAEQGQPARVGRRLGHGHRDPQDGVRPQVLLVGGAVEVEHPLVDADLVEGVHLDQFGSDLIVDVLDRLEHPFTEVLRLVAVAEFKGLVDARARPAGHAGAAEGAVFEGHVHLDGGVSAAIEDLPGVDIDDRGTHRVLLLERQARGVGDGS